MHAIIKSVRYLAIQEEHPMSINTLTRWSFVFSVGLALAGASALAAEPSAVKNAKSA